MKKTLATLALLLELGLTGIAQESQKPDTNFVQERTVNKDFIRNRVFERIDNIRTFEKACYWEHMVGCDTSENNGEYIRGYYNFDYDNNPDIIACFKPAKTSKLDDCLPYGADSAAEIVMVDIDRDGSYKLVYMDNNKDNLLEEKIEEKNRIDQLKRTLSRLMGKD